MLPLSEPVQERPLPQHQANKTPCEQEREPCFCWHPLGAPRAPTGAGGGGEGEKLGGTGHAGGKGGNPGCAVKLTASLSPSPVSVFSPAGARAPRSPQRPPQPPATQAGMGEHGPWALAPSHTTWQSLGPLHRGFLPLRTLPAAEGEGHPTPQSQVASLLRSPTPVALVSGQSCPHPSGSPGLPRPGQGSPPGSPSGFHLPPVPQRRAPKRQPLPSPAGPRVREESAPPFPGLGGRAPETGPEGKEGARRGEEGERGGQGGSEGESGKAAGPHRPPAPTPSPLPAVWHPVPPGRRGRRPTT